jgi:hypothetical protein
MSALPLFSNEPSNLAVSHSGFAKLSPLVLWRRIAGDSHPYGLPAVDELDALSDQVHPQGFNSGRQDVTPPLKLADRHFANIGNGRQIIE